MTRWAIALVAAALVAAPTAAQDGGDGLDAARAAGTVGERYDGYPVALAGAGDAVRRQVGKVVIIRRALYTRQGTQSGTGAAAIGQLTACRIIAALDPGSLYQLADGAWRRVGASGRAMLPDYCG